MLHQNPWKYPENIILFKLRIAYARDGICFRLSNVLQFAFYIPRFQD